MSKIERYAGNLRAFASEAQGLERTLFGETAQANDLTSQVTAAFLRGWGVVGPSEHPSLEDFNAAMYAMSQFIAYQHQMGIPEWHAAQEYYIGSLCVRAGETYSSLENGNVGSAPPSAKWTPVLTSKNGLTNLGLGAASRLPSPTFTTGTGYTLFKSPYYDGATVRWFATLSMNVTPPALTNGQTFSVTFPVAFSSDVKAVLSSDTGELTNTAAQDLGCRIQSLSTTGMVILSAWGARATANGDFQFIVTGIMNA